MDDLVKIALAGTNRMPFDAARDERPAVRLVGRSRSSSAEGDTAAALLDACGAESVYRFAGYLPARNVPPLAPAPTEDRPFASSIVAAAAEGWFSRQTAPAIFEFARELERAGLLIPPELLPTTLAIEDRGLRRALASSLGNRGRWLAALEGDAAAWTAPSRESTSFEELRPTFERGNIDERIAALTDCRKIDRGESRRWLEEAFPSEKAENRRRLLQTLETDVGPDDEAFLETARNDRSAQVAALAKRLLAEIPSSQLVGRLTERAGQILQGSRNWLRKLSLRVEFPKEIPEDWKRDAGGEDRIGQKSEKWNLVLAILRAVPLAHWEKQFGATPEALVGAIAEEDDADAVACAWTASLARDADARRDGQWWRALFDYASALKGSGEKRTVRDPLALRRLGPLVDETNVDRWLSLPERLPVDARDAWFADTRSVLDSSASEKTAPAFAARIRRELAASPTDEAYRWASLLESVALVLPFDAMPAALVPWKLPESDTWHARRTGQLVESFFDVVSRRRRLVEQIRAEAPSRS